MNEELKMSEEKEEISPSFVSVTAQAPYGSGNIPTMWSDVKLMNSAWRTANMLSKSGLMPQETYYGRPENVLICIDIANRMNVSPLMVAQNLYIVKGKPAWSGSFAVAAINGCGKFTPLEFIFSEDGQGCHAEAKRISDGKLCVSTEITMQLAKNEGWIDKSGSKWKTMPQQMMMYRAASFFAKVYCPEILFGIQTVEEVKDTKGYDETEKQTVKISLEDSYGKFQ